MLQIPIAGKMTQEQVRRYRAILAFQLRACQMEHRDIARVLNVRTVAQVKRYIEIGRRTLIDCVIQTVV